MKINAQYVAALAAVSAAAAHANAAITAFVGDTTIEGGWDAFEAASGINMKPIISDWSEFAVITSIDTSLGPFTMSSFHQKRTVPGSWATWSHGGPVTGEVFVILEEATSATYTVPRGVVAYDMYIEPVPFLLETFVVTATGSFGTVTTTTMTAHGFSGASHVGFWSTGGEALVSVHVAGAIDYAIGEMRINHIIPAPGVMSLLGCAGCMTRRRRRSSQRRPVRTT